MLTVYDLNGFLDKLDDLTRAEDPMVLVAEATQLIDDNDSKLFLNQRRAALAADAHYLRGVPMARIARACGKSTQAVRNWLAEYGPKHYLTIGEEPDGAEPGRTRLVVRLVKVVSDDMVMKRLLRQQVKAGRRIVPANRNLLAPDRPEGHADFDARAVYDELAP